MARQQTIHLNESDAAAARPVKVIDAEFRVVGRQRWLERLWVALVAVFWAAVLGFLFPFAWIFAENVGAFFAQ